jgi:hypothetical protein
LFQLLLLAVRNRMQPRWCRLRGNSIKKGFMVRTSSVAVIVLN